MGYLELKVLNYLRNNGSITVKTCENNIGSTELRKFISNLRHRGYGINDYWEQGFNRYGIKTRWKRYYLEKEVGAN